GLEDLRVINVAVATMKAGAAPQTRAAARACIAWIEKKDPAWVNAKEHSFNAQAARRLKVALDDTPAAASAEPAAAEPLPPRPVFEGWANIVDFENALTAYYGDLNDLRKCSPQDVAFLEDYLKQRDQQLDTPDGRRGRTAEEKLAIEWAIEQGVPEALLARMRKVAQVPAEFHAAWTALHGHAYDLEGKSAPSDKRLKAARPSVASLSPKHRIAFLTTVLDVLTPGHALPTDNLARALVFLSADWAADAVGPILTRHAQKVCFASNPPWGIRDERRGNACLWALIHLPKGGGVSYLARLLSRVKYPKVKKRIEAALNE